jgi:DNA polymerase III delta prime subunit
MAILLIIGAWLRARSMPLDAPTALSPKGRDTPETYTRPVIGDAVAAGFRTLGQGATRRLALHAAQRDELGRTLLVHGPRGAGKDAFVDDLLALLFCQGGDVEARPCNACRGCRDGRARTHPDLVAGSPELWRELRTSGESIVSAARRWLLDAAGAPVVAERRVVLVDGADRANEQAQNALLKVLEEPTDRHTFVLVAEDARRLLPTIRSRCRPLRIGPVPRAELAAHLMDAMRLPADQADALAQLSGGLVGTAHRFVEHKDHLDWRRRVQSELITLLDRGRAERLAAVRDLIDDATSVAAPLSAVEPLEVDADLVRTPPSTQRAAAALIVDAWLGLARDLLVASVGRSELAPSGQLAGDAGPRLEEIAARLTPDGLVEMLGFLERVRDALGDNAAPRLALEAAMLRWPMPDPTRTSAR